MRRAPAKPVRARCVCECVALLPSRNMTCVRPPCTARPREDSLHTSQFRLHSLHFKSHTSSHLKLHFSNFWHTANFHTEKLLHTEARSFCTQQAFTQRSQKLLHTESFTHTRLLHSPDFYTEKLLHTEAFTQRSFYAQKLLHRSAFSHRTFYTQQTLIQKCFYTQKLLHRAVFAHKSFYTKKLWHRKAFTHSKLLHREVFTHRCQMLLHTEAFTHSKLWHRAVFTKAFTERSF